MVNQSSLCNLIRNLTIPINKEKYLITGAQGFLGSWILKKLVKKGHEVLGVDIMMKPHILQQICSLKELEMIKLNQCNITDLNALRDLFYQYEPTYVLHLAGAQVPTCKLKPSLGALINILGTANIFDVARNQKSVKSIVYASSAAVCGPSEDYPGKKVTENDFNLPRTLYGVYKQATEEMGRIFWQDYQLSSAGFRPLVCYGPGREVGISSDPTKAIKSAILESKFEINFRGPTVFNFAPDVANCFIDSCEIIANKPGNFLCNISHFSSTVEKFLDIVNEILPETKNLLSINPNAIILPFPEVFEDLTLNSLLGNDYPITSLKNGIKETIRIFKKLKREKRLYNHDIISK